VRNSRVANVMTRDVVSIRSSTPFKDVVRILLEHEISTVPVVDEGYHVDGVVSQADLIEKEAHQVEGYPEPWELLTRELDGVVAVVDRLRIRIQERPATRPFSSPAH
jgi:CBS-domain-containing membrane protein